MKLFLNTFIIILLSSCSKTADFKVDNYTNTTIDSLNINHHFGNKNYSISLKPGESKNYKLDMTDAGGDGSYFLFYKINDSIGFKQFGYYTNGSQVEHLTEIKIKSDTVLIKHTL